MEISTVGYAVCCVSAGGYRTYSITLFVVVVLSQSGNVWSGMLKVHDSAIQVVLALGDVPVTAIPR